MDPIEVWFTGEYVGYRSKWIPKKLVGQFQIYPKIEICDRVSFYLNSIGGFQKRPCALWRLRPALPGALREPAGDSARHWMGNDWEKPIFDLIKGGDFHGDFNLFYGIFGCNVFFGILFGIFFGIFFGVYFNIFFWMLFGILFIYILVYLCTFY